MQIEEWLEREKKSVNYLAGRLDVTRQTVYGWMNGDFLPSAQKLMKLYEITSGDVSLEDFRAKLQELRDGESVCLEKQIREGVERGRSYRRGSSSGS